MEMSAPENLPEIAKGMIERAKTMERKKERDINYPRVDERAIMLHSVIMGAAGHFIGGLRWEPIAGSKASERYLRNTNLDVITAEAIIWIEFLMARFISNEAKEEQRSQYYQEPMILVLVGDSTRREARLINQGAMKKFTGFDFEATKYFAERFRYYQEAAKDGSVSFELFAAIVIKSIGRQSPADPLKVVGPFPLPEWIALSQNVATFFATMPLKYYETFKDMLVGGMVSDIEWKRIIARQKAMK
jgi:hypothetical protein